MENRKEIARRRFGCSDFEVTRVGLGGEGVLRSFGYEKEAEVIIRAAVMEGISYFDSARAYAGSEIYYGRFWRDRKQLRGTIFQASKSTRRTRKEALADLDFSLECLGMDYIDLWQIHDVRTFEDLEKIGGPGGALEAFLEARDRGKVRHIGVTGHYDPAVLAAAVKEWPIDAVMMPVSPVERVIGGFLDATLAAANEKGIAVIGMKILGGSHFISEAVGITSEALIRFALSQPVTLIIVGCSKPADVRLMAASAREKSPMPPAEQEKILELFRPHAEKLAYYRRVT
ncbi:MAG: aldo/keto reductase [Syntrophales bacterium]|nr:aldo/keto reductase [Syntrophales bacterium]MDD5232419.1 aldo/keto reductase [Syntrophales bacterium]MDD5531951.1 aldo/keto reductase [Syntrophales bacterium]HPL64791.1 aldo/keto reductase [Syntrophales bacterium]